MPPFAPPLLPNISLVNAIAAAAAATIFFYVCVARHRGRVCAEPSESLNETRELSCPQAEQRTAGNFEERRRDVPGQVDAKER